MLCYYGGIIFGIDCDVRCDVDFYVRAARARVRSVRGFECVSC